MKTLTPVDTILTQILTQTHFFPGGSDWFCVGWLSLSLFDPCLIRELKQPRRRRQQKPHKICIFDNEKQNFIARFARAFFVFWHFEDVLVLSTT